MFLCRYIKIFKSVVLSILCFGPLLLAGCNTGIESTRRVTPSRLDRRELAETPEDTVMHAIHLSPLRDWKEGRPFLVADDRMLLIYESRISPEAMDTTRMKGSVICFSRTLDRLTPNGSMERWIVFSDDQHEFGYNTGKSPEAADSSFFPLDAPMLIDLTSVEEAREILSGLTLWTRSPLRYDDEGERIAGERFVPVEVVDVVAGDVLFPLHLKGKETDGRISNMYLSISNSGLESRTFPSMFFLSDPKKRYPAISPEVWKLIQEGKVRNGMTKDECRLALGNPDDVNSGHNWSSTIDLWSYRNGMFLQFQDGLLVNYRM